MDEQSVRSVRRHLARTGQRAQVRVPGQNFRDVSFPVDKNAKVAIVVPTRNQAALLKDCVAGLERTIRKETADLFVVNHESKDPATHRLLADLRDRHTVLSYAGRFNFSAMMNAAVRSIPLAYSHILFLNNDTEATGAGWLEHMLGLACRADVGVVGAMLLYPEKHVQHAGVVVGLRGSAEHAHRFDRFLGTGGERHPGYNGALLATRDCSAVTGACLLIRSSLFNRLRVSMSAWQSVSVIPTCVCEPARRGSEHWWTLMPYYFTMNPCHAARSHMTRIRPIVGDLFDGIGE